MQHFEMRTALPILFSLFFAGCSSSLNVDEQLSILGLTILDDYEIVDIKSESAIGDMSFEFQLELGDKAYNDLVKQIERHETFEIIDSIGVHSSTFTNWQRTDRSLFAGKIGDRHFIELLMPKRENGIETYVVSVEPNRLRFHFTQE